MHFASGRKAVVEGLLAVYRQGAFPMADPDTGEIAFYSASRRGLLPLHADDGLHVPRSLRRRLNSTDFELTSDTAFEAVVRACAEPRPDDEEGTWINETIVEWATALFDAGHAHSVEAWRTEDRTGERRLVGGIYGVCIGGAFFGESMFSRPLPRSPGGARHPFDGTDASKVCLVRLIEHLRRRGYALFDAQFTNPHLERFGCYEVDEGEYLRRLERAIARPTEWGRFESIAGG